VTTKKIAKKGSIKGRSRGRPRGFDLDEAIALAADLFHRRGYDGVGVAELSAKMGITAPSLYSAFGSKRELFEKSLQYYVQAEGSWLPTALVTAGPLEVAMGSLFRRAAEVYSAHPERPGCLVLDGTRNCGDAEAQALTLGYRQATRQLICDRIQSSTPALSPAQIESLADYALMILIGLSGSARDGISVDVLRATAKIAALGFAQQLHSLSSRVSS
jgi:TetR/AcrR family transcriptional regulator, repressor for divergent bdcA